MVLSKTDALGDQMLATGLIAELLDARPEARIIWFVRSGNESLSSLLDGSIVWKVDPDQQPARQASRALRSIQPDSRPWSRLLFVPVPINPYKIQTDDFDETLTWWSRFARRLRPDVSIVGSTTRNWLDQFLVSSSQAPRRIGFGPSYGSQENTARRTSHLPGKLVGLTDEIAFTESLAETERLHILATTASGRSAPFQPRITLSHSTASVPANRLKHSLVIAPGVGDSRRRVDSAALADGVAGFLKGNDHFAGRCLLVEGPLDRKIASEVGRALRIHGLSVSRFRFGPDDLPKLAALLQDTPLFLSHETFYVQLAALLKTPTVAIWGLGHWKRFFPSEADMTIVHATMACAGCEWNCLFERWKCITDLPAGAITEGLEFQWRRKASNSLHFINTKSPVAETEVTDSLRRAGRDASRLRDENHRLSLWIDQLTQRTRELEKWARSEETKRVAAEKHHDDAAGQRDRFKAWAEKEKEVRTDVQGLLAQAEKQRDDREKARLEETHLRHIAEDLRRDAERQRDEAKAWAGEEQRLRLAAERLLRQTEKQREDAHSHAQEAERLRGGLERVLRETEAQRDNHLVWAEDERTRRIAAEDLTRETEKQREAAIAWAEEEKTRRESLQKVLDETEIQRGAARTWAEEERTLRTRAEVLRLEAEQQVADLRAWAEQERNLRQEAANFREMAEAQRDTASHLRIDAENQRDAATKWAKEEEAIRENLERVLADAEKQRDAAVKWAKEEQAIRENLQSVLADAEKQRDDVTKWAKEERAIRETLQGVLADAEKQSDERNARAEKEKSLRQRTEFELRQSVATTESLKGELTRFQSEITRQKAAAKSFSDLLAGLRDELEEMTRQRDRYERLGLCRFTVRAAETLSRKSRP